MFNNTVAIYARLSREDEQDYLSKSKSIESQIKAIRTYCEENEMDVFSEYMDDGYTGSNFNRPAFKQMIADMEEKKFNCIIVKDISRLGRNLMLTSKYIEEVFPNNKIRFVSLNDKYDSLITPPDDISIVMKNFLNDLYYKETRRKERDTIDRRSKSKNLNVRTKFGYLLDKDRKFIVDPETAPIVKLIFEMIKKGETYNSVTTYLREHKIHTPSEYQHMRVKSNLKLSIIPYGWTLKAIQTIIKDYEYCGNLINLNYTTRKNVAPVTIMNTHEAIIDEETFKKANAVITARHIVRLSDDYRLTKIVRCKECGGPMHAGSYCNKKSSYNYTYYSCHKCYKKINMEFLHDVVYQETKKMIEDITSDKEGFERRLLEEVQSRYNYRDDKVLTKELQEITSQMKKLFENKILGLINEVTCNNKITELNVRKEALDLEMYQVNKINNIKKNYLTNFNKFMRLLSHELPVKKLDFIREFVEKIIVDKDKTIKIIYKYQSEE